LPTTQSAAERALNTTAELARLSRSAVTVLGVVPPVPYGSELSPLLDEAPDTLALALDRAREELEARGVDATVEECEGDPAGASERLADLDGFDTIVVDRVIGARCGASSAEASPLTSRRMPTRPSSWRDSARETSDRRRLTVPGRQ